jgi:murein DD-endopeptidase MepM/ murein hydrolase activator NlpD
MRHFFGLLKLESASFFLFGFTIFVVLCNYVASLKYSPTLNIEKIISSRVAFDEGALLENDQQESHKSLYAQEQEYIDSRYDYTVQSGDSFIKILTDIGLQSSSAYVLSKEVDKIHSIRNINVGQTISLLLCDKYGGQVKQGDAPYNIVIHINDKIIEATYKEASNSYSLKLLKQTFNNKSKLVVGFAKDSLYNNAVASGAPPSIVINYIKLLSHDVDFKRDVRSNSEFKILFDYNENSHGKKISDGDIIYALLSVGNKKIEIYQYKDSKGKISYYHKDGRNLTKTFLDKPMKQIRVSSGFGMRYHPIHKRRKMHKGVDYAASTGTPILATGDGVVQMAKYGAGYGKYITIKHNSKYTTLYAHMSKFKPGIKPSTHIKQGQVIGYVGATGAATGSHLHYEVIKHGKQINPEKVTRHIYNPLEGKMLVAFNSQKKKIDEIIYKESTIMLAKNTSLKIAR